MRKIRTIRLAVVATIAASAVTGALALPAYAAFSGFGQGYGTTLAAAEHAALQDMHGNFSGCSGPIKYYDEFFHGTYYTISVSQSPCEYAN